MFKCYLVEIIMLYFKLNLASIKLLHNLRKTIKVVIFIVPYKNMPILQGRQYTAKVASI